MNEKLEQIKKTVVPILKKSDIVRSAFFGSVVRGDFNDESDIDILIEFQDKKTLFDLVGLQQELEQALNRKVDLVTYRSLYPKLREIIEKEEIVIV